MQSQACAGAGPRLWLPDPAAWRRALHVALPGPLPRRSRPLAAPLPRALEAKGSSAAGTSADAGVGAAAAAAGGRGGEAEPGALPPLSEEEARALNKRISGAASAAEVLALVGPRLGALSRINAITAFHRLAKVRGRVEGGRL